MNGLLCVSELQSNSDVSGMLNSLVYAHIAKLLEKNNSRILQHHDSRFYEFQTVLENLRDFFLLGNATDFQHTTI